MYTIITMFFFLSAGDTPTHVRYVGLSNLTLAECLETKERRDYSERYEGVSEVTICIPNKDLYSGVVFKSN